MLNFKNVLLISGSGRNVGKTLLACRIIEENKLHLLTSIKIAGHLHQLQTPLEILIQEEDWLVGREVGDNDKDSGRYYSAGSSLVYYVQMRDGAMTKFLNWFEKNINQHSPVIIESASIGDFIQPGLAIYVQDENPSKKCRWEFNYMTVNTINGQLPIELPQITLKNQIWQTVK